jgi:hypothetical protein
MARRSTKNKPVTYRPPFRNSGNFVLDSLGMVLCQFMPTEFIRVNKETHETAKWVVDALNAHASSDRREEK